jgi:hypothetical protein
MKGGREHRVPLCDRATAILREMQQGRVSDYVFPGAKRGVPLSNMAVGMILRRMDTDVTVHGFRSAIRHWSAECTNFPNEVCEAALAHVIENKAEAAYRRGDMLDRRRKLMDAWAAYLDAPADAKVLPLAKRRTATALDKLATKQYLTVDGRGLRHPAICPALARGRRSGGASREPSRSPERISRQWCCD